MAPKAAQKKKVDEEAKAEEPPAKKAKPEEDAEAAKKPAEPEEKEKDAPKAKAPLLEKTVGFDPSGYTLNVVPAMGGTMLMSLSDGGMQFLMGGARANVGLTAGRYMYEAKVVEVLMPDEGKQHHGQRGKMWQKHMIRVGFSTEGSSLILGDGDDCIAFDGDGTYIADGKKSPPKHTNKFWRDKVVGVLLNLDSKSDNANTISLFRDGVRVTEPMPLPDKLKGKPLFPHVTFRNVSVQMNFGPSPLKPLPFKCLMVQGASKADTKAAAAPAAKATVVFPVGMPDEGTFDVLDAFLEKNPSYTELSDRKVLEWAVKSGAWKGAKSTGSNDKPPFDFGMEMLDNKSACRVIGAMAPCVARDYVFMEVKQNLCAEDRKANLQKFSSARFKKVARVAMGKPPKEYIEKVHKTLLEKKQAKLELEWNKRKAEKAKQKAFKQKQKELAEKRKKAEEEKKKREEEAKAKKEEEAKAKQAAEEAKKAAEEGDKKEEAKKEGEAKAEEPEVKKEEAKEEPKAEEAKEEPKAEEAKEEPKAEEAKEEPKAEEEEEEPDEPMPVAELTEDEKATCYMPVLISDLAPKVLSTSFGKFSIPDKSEGFDDIVFEWEPQEASAKYLKDHVLKLKTTSRIDDLTPGEWFKTTSAEFEKLSAECQEKAKKVTEAQKKKDDDPPADVFGVEDVHNVGDGLPLYKLFSFEDWALHALRCELYLLAAAYKKDVDDPERPGIHEDHIAFYFGKYFKKSIMPKHYGKDTIADLLTMVKDTASIDPENGVLTLKIEDDKPADYFVKKQEENRRERQRRIDAGDETARLDFSALQKQKEAAEKQAAGRAQKEKEMAEKQKEMAEKMKAAGAAAGPVGAPVAAGKVPTGKMVPPKGQSDKGKGGGPKGGGKGWQPPGKQGGKKW